MKKLLVILSLVLIVGLGACSPSSTDLEQRVIDLENEVITLQDNIDLLEERFDNLVVTTGLNGQTVYYENESYNELINDAELSMSLLGYEMIAKEADFIDKAKFPDYIWDINGDYITVDDLGNLLTQKYIGISSETTIGFQYRMTIYKPADMEISEFMARLSMMIMELSYYDFYTIDSPELYIIINTGASQSVKVRMSLLVSDRYNLHPAIFWGELMDTSVIGFSYNTTIVQEYYDNFILNETFNGYVLNYN